MQISTGITATRREWMPGVSILRLHIAQWVRECVRNKGNAYQGSHAVAGRTGCSAGMVAARDRNRGAADGGGWSGPRTTLPDPGAGPEDRAVPGYVRGNDQSPWLGGRIPGSTVSAPATDVAAGRDRHDAGPGAQRCPGAVDGVCGAGLSTGAAIVPLPG